MSRKPTILLKKPSALNTGKFKALIENAYDGIVLYDASGIVQYASPSIKNFGGYAPHDLIGRSGTDFVYEEDAPAAREAFLKVLSMPGKSITHVQRFINKKGKIQWSEYTLTNLLHNPDVRGVVSNFRDIHEKKIAEEEAIQARNLLNTISENVVDGIFFGIPGQEFQYVNNAFLDIIGYKSIQDLRKIKPHRLFVEEERWKEINALLDEGKSIKNEQALFRKKNGESFWGSLSLSIFEDENKQVRFVGSVRDITQQKKAEEELYNSQQLLSSISQNINEGLFRSNGKRFLFVNEAFVKTFGYASVDEMMGTPPQKLYARPKERSKILADLKRVTSRTLEILYKRKTGELFWGQVSYTVIKDKNGQFLMDGALRDITKQKEAEKKLNESRTFLDNVMRTVAAPIYVKDNKLQWVMFNDAFCWFMGKKRVELLGKSEADFFSDEDFKKSRRMDHQVLRTGDIMLSRDTIHVNKSLVKHVLTVKSRFINDQKEKFLIGFITDITEIREREEEINKLNANLLGVLESTHESIYSIDRDFNYVAYNKNHARMSKLIYGATISIGSSCIDYIKGTPEYRWLQSELKRALRGEHFVSEQKVDGLRYSNRFIQTTYNPVFDRKNHVTGVAVFVRDVTDLKLAQTAINQTNATLSGVIESTKDRIFAVDTGFKYLMFNRGHALTMKRIAGREIQKGDSIIKFLPKALLPQAKKQLRKAMQGTPSTLEFSLLNQFLEASVNPIKDNRGNIIGATMFVRDMTHRKKTEEKLRLLNEELTGQNWRLAAQEEELRSTLEELSERNFELDQLMYKTSHDLRSPLSSILGLVNLAYIDKEPENQMKYLGKIEGRIKKLDEFIRSMLDYARVNRSEIVLENINLKALIENCVHELEYLENFTSVEIKTEIKTGKVTFISDPLLVKIIFSNIISNAYKYYNPGVKSYLLIRVKVNPLNVQIILKDNGIGIEKEYVTKVFEMFYRATEKSQGSGLGMYIVKQAVEKLKGSIQVTSTFGKGTTFKIMLPNN